MKRVLALALAGLFFLAACTPYDSNKPVTDQPVVPPQEKPTETPMPVLPEDPMTSREPVFIEEQGLLIRESFPPQIALGLSGNLPTPCHQLRAEVSPPDAENKIVVDVYSTADPGMLCTQVLSPFSETIELGTFPSGHYSVWMNGELVGEFDS